MSNGSSETLGREFLIESLKSEGILKTQSIENALNTVDRAQFLWPGEPRSAAYIDEPLGLGDTGQTISAPHMVVMMLEQLDLKPGLKVLEVGAGSGYNAALVGEIVSGGIRGQFKDPLVISIERDERLAKFARENLKQVGLDKTVSVEQGDGSLGYPPRSKERQYDRILVTAGAPFVPPYLEWQLKANGILLVPVGSLPYQKLTKISNELKDPKDPSKGCVKKSQRLVDCMFVPLIGEAAHNF